MKKICLALLVLVMLFSCTACRRHKNKPTEPMPTESSAVTNPAESTVPTESKTPTESSAAPTETTAAAETTGVPTTAPTTVPTTAPTTEPPFVIPANTTVYHTELGGMTEEQARDALREKAEDYTLTLSANGNDTSLSAGELGLNFSEDALHQFCSDLKAGKKADGGNIVTFAPGSAVESYCDDMTSYASDADVRFDSSTGRFEAISEHYGKGINRETVSNRVSDAIRDRDTWVDVSDACYSWGPDVSAEDDRVKNAMDEANRYLDVSLTYVCTPESGEEIDYSVSRSDVASFVRINDDYEVYVSRDAIEEFVSDMADECNLGDYSGDFLATGGFTVGYTVSYYGQSLDQYAVVEDMYDCIVNGISGNREAPYRENTGRPYGGNYVEISLTDQYLWVYRDGDCVASTPIVSGCVADGNATPTGVYEVTDLDTDCYLTGPTWEDYVNYWIGFYGNYGIHDASWRDTFGGDEYIYNGSHGCANLPVGNAGAVYDNVYVGMKVILYGGVTSADPSEQEISCQEYFDVADDAQPFLLGEELRYEGADMTYTSDNPDVVQVGRDGTVTVSSVGSADILIEAEEFSHYTSDELTVTVNVHSACEEGRHEFGDWALTRKPTADEPGEETRTCSKCGETETREVPPVESDEEETTETSETTQP